MFDRKKGVNQIHHHHHHHHILLLHHHQYCIYTIYHRTKRAMFHSIHVNANIMCHMTYQIKSYIRSYHIISYHIISYHSSEQLLHRNSPKTAKQKSGCFPPNPIPISSHLPWHPQFFFPMKNSLFFRLEEVHPVKVDV